MTYLGASIAINWYKISEQFGVELYVLDQKSLLFIPIIDYEFWFIGACVQTVHQANYEILVSLHVYFVYSY